MKLLVVSWGDFERWKETKYRFGEETSVGPSTLPILQKTINPDWTVIILSDTLGKDFSSVQAIREDVTTRLMDFLDRIGAGREVDVIIAPGIGQFSHGTFRGSAMDAYYFVLHHLTQILPPNESLEVHFDSTHGLNYITLLTYRALKDLLGIAAITNEVHFKAYNSDPYVQGITRELTINTIEDTPVLPKPLENALPSTRVDYLRGYEISGKEFGEVLKGINAFNWLRENKGLLNAWISSVVNGLPLVFASAYPELKGVENAIEELLTEYNNHITVSGNTLMRRLSLGPGFSVLVKLLFQARVLHTSALPDPEPSIEKLLAISERIFRGRLLASTKTELDRLARSVGFDTNGWVSYAELLRKQGKNPNSQVDDRNFLAHAGLEANLIEVKRDGELYIRYTDKKVTYGGRKSEAWKVIEKITEKSLGG